MNHGRAVGKSLSHSRRDGGGWSGLAARRAHRAAGRGLPAEPPPANPVAAPRVRRPIPDLRNRRAGEIVPDVGIPHLEPVAIVFETADPQVGAAVGPALRTRVADSAEGCLVLFTYRTAGAATPRAEPDSFGEAGYSSSAAFTSSPFKRRAKTFDDPKAAGRPPRLRKVSRNHTPRWFTGKR